jgi:hypothetical protein
MKYTRTRFVEFGINATLLVIRGPLTFFVRHPKNHNSKSYKRLRELRDECQCPMIGLTGTIMNNNHEELYNLIDLHAPGHLGDEEDFKTRFSEPIKYARYVTIIPDRLFHSVDPLTCFLSFVLRQGQRCRS